MKQSGGQRSTSNNKSEYQSTLSYYQDKVDQLYQERLGWLSKFDQCNSHLLEKQKMQKSLKELKDKQLDTGRAIVHHNVALLDERLNVIRMDRENLIEEFKDAEELIKIEELIEEFPIELEKQLPCRISELGKQTISNDLNIHNYKGNTLKDKKRSQENAMNFQKEKSEGIMIGGIKTKLKVKPTTEDLMKRQIIQLNANQQKEISAMEYQVSRLEDIIKEVKQKESKSLKAERQVIDQLKQQAKMLEKKYKNIAENYFASKKQLKEENNEFVNQNQRLQQTIQNFEGKVANELKIYQKQNKAKQTLILKKSQDFQQDYKARMRAKQRNLQALKDNYQKMQQVCIEKIKKLQATLDDAKKKLSQAENRRQFLIFQLRQQLNQLQRKNKEQNVQKAKFELQLKQKLQQERLEKEQAEEREARWEKKGERDRLIEQAYFRDSPMKPKSNSKSKSKSKSKPQISISKEKGILKNDRGSKASDRKKSSKRTSKKNELEEEEEESEQSMQMSDLQNLRKQINKLQQKICDESKKK